MISQFSILVEGHKTRGGRVKSLLTWLVHLATLGVGRVRVARRIGHLTILVNHTTATVSAVHLAISGLVPDRGKLRTNTAGVGWGLSSTLCRVWCPRCFDLVCLSGLSGSSTLTFLGSLALSLFLLLAGLPFFADLFEFCSKKRKKCKLSVMPIDLEARKSWGMI